MIFLEHILCLQFRLVSPVFNIAIYWSYILYSSVHLSIYLSILDIYSLSFLQSVLNTEQFILNIWHNSLDQFFDWFFIIFLITHLFIFNFLNLFLNLKFSLRLHSLHFSFFQSIIPIILYFLNPFPQSFILFIPFITFSFNPSYRNLSFP